MKRDADSLSPAETRVMQAVIETRGGNISRIAEALHVTARRRTPCGGDPDSNTSLWATAPSSMIRGR